MLMSTSAIPHPNAHLATVPPPIPAVPPPIPGAPPSVSPVAEEPSLWERTLLLAGTSFGVSLLLHVCVFSMLAFWMFRRPMPEILVIDSGVYDARKLAEVDTQEVKIAPPSIPKADVTPLKSAAAVNAASSGSPKIDFELDVPEVLGEGTGTTGGDGKGVFGSGTTAKSYVFVVDCSASMYGPRFQLAISELLRTIGQLRSNQRFYVVFYSDVTIPMFAKPAVSNAADAGINAGRFTARGLNGRMNRFGNGRAGNARRRPVKFVRKPSQKLITATAANKARAKQWIQQIRPGGGTLPAEALQIALAMKPQVVYFLTDGAIPFNTPQTVRDANRSRVIVNTVALGYEGSESLLKTIASENNGHYRFVK